MIIDHNPLIGSLIVTTLEDPRSLNYRAVHNRILDCNRNQIMLLNLSSGMFYLLTTVHIESRAVQMCC